MKILCELFAIPKKTNKLITKTMHLLNITKSTLVVVNRLISVPILSQVIKIKMEVQVLNPQGLWLYLSDANSIIKQ